MSWRVKVVFGLGSIHLIFSSLLTLEGCHVRPSVTRARALSVCSAGGFICRPRERVWIFHVSVLGVGVFFGACRPHARVVARRFTYRVNRGE